MSRPVAPPPRSVAIELVGGPHCGTETIAQLGLDGQPPPVMPTRHGGTYLRTDRRIRPPGGGYALSPGRIAYTWRFTQP